MKGRKTKPSEKCADCASQKMLALIRSFPTLAKHEDCAVGWGQAFKGGHWDPVAFDHWTYTSPSVTSGSRQAAKFVLSVWSGQAIHLSPPKTGPWDAPATEWDCPWKIGGFDLMHALKVWDDAHKKAFLDWAKAPWWV